MRGTLLQLGVLAAAACSLASVAYAADVRSARVWAGPDYTRVVLDLSGPVHYQLSQSGERVTLDLGRNALARGFAAPGSSGRLKRLDIRQQGGQLELFADVTGGTQPKSFLLKPDGSYGYRLVLDLYPPDARPPTKATLGAKPKAPAAATPRSEARRSGSDILNLRQVAAQMNGQRKVVVAIDAGHGGKDPGARGPDGTLEKNVTLAVAKKLAALIDRQPGMQAVLTRTGDYFIPLKRRYQIARDDSADMFVSIHADAFKNGDAKGSSVWVLSPRGKTSEAARWLADRENRADLVGGVSLDDKDDSLAAVLLDLQQGYAMQASDSIAANVLKALARIGPTHRGYVERANFVVLRSPDVPSILVETAFISNPKEERKLRNPAHQEALARAVMGGVRNYFEATPPPGTWFAAQAAEKAAATLAARDAAHGVKATPRLASVRAPSADRHRVHAGESLTSIALRYGVSVAALRSANGLSGSVLQAGTTLTIPSG